MSLLRALAKAADDAKMLRRPPPIIVTDINTASILIREAEIEQGGRLVEPGANQFKEPIYDGVRITHPGHPLPEGWPEPPQHQAWRDHFGALADIWE